MARDLIVRSDIIRYLGVWMDKELNFKQHVTKKCQCAMINYKRIQSIRHLLDIKTTESLFLSLYVSHLDYCNSVLYGLPVITINKLQRMQNMCACLVLRKTKYNSAREYLKCLHWLPIRQRIAYKILVLTFKALHGEGPMYLQELIQKQQPGKRNLRSNNKNLLVRPHTKLKTFATRPFKVATPELWNDIPSELRSACSLLKFKNGLKTFLYQQAFC